MIKASTTRELTPEAARKFLQRVYDNANGIKRRPLDKSYDYICVEYTSWGGVNSWFVAKENKYDELRFETEDDAKAYISAAKKMSPDSDFRITHVKVSKRYEYV